MRLMNATVWFGTGVYIAIQPVARGERAHLAI